LKSYLNDLLVILVMGFNRLDKGNGGMVGREVVELISDNKKIISEFFICFFEMKLL